MRFRQITNSDTDQLEPLLTGDPVLPFSLEEFHRRVGEGVYRHEWTWIAEEEASANIAAVMMWWGFPGDDRPSSLDAVYAADTSERVTVTAKLILTARETYDALPPLHVFLPPDWRERPDAIAAFSWRELAAREAGMAKIIERLTFEWTPSDGLPPASTRLVFRAETDDAVFAALFRQVLEGTLDATSREGAAMAGAAAQAWEDLEFYRDKMLGKRSWWRVAQTADGTVVGFGVPSRNPAMASVGYLGVLPEHRGHGYGTDILAEITRILALEAGATLIGADTDLENRPMAAAFARAGYRTIASHLVISAS